MRSRSLLFFLSILVLSPVFSQEPASETGDTAIERIVREKLRPAIEKLYHPKKGEKKLSDEEKLKINETLLRDFEEAILVPGTFDHDFDSLKQDIGILRAPDNSFRIIHWNIPKNDGTHAYFGFLHSKHIQITKKGMFRKERTELLQLYPLIDRSAEIRNPENSILDNKKWYGCLYYKIIRKKTRTKTYYTLLGWDGNDAFSQKKIIEVLTFDQKGLPKFGADIFSLPKRYPKRVIFEYSASCGMSLKYSERKDSIVFDHLAPTQPQLEGQFQYYCGDMSYDGLGFRNGKWNYGKDLNAVNEKDEKDRLYIDPKDRSQGSRQSEPINPMNKSIDKKKKEENLKKEKKKKKD